MSNRYLIIYTVLSTQLLSSCIQNDKSPFKQDLSSAGSTPWTMRPTARDADQFAFAIISDLNSGEREGVFEVAVEQLKLLKPEFIMSIGDLIDGGTEDTAILRQQFDNFDSRVKKAGVPFFHVGGNHDLTNVTMRNFWEKRYGKRYYHFIYNNALFLILDTEDYNENRMKEIYEARARAIELLDSGKKELAEQSDYFKMPERKFGEIGSEQSAYFAKVIKDNPNVRWAFLFMHKPVWQVEGKNNLSQIEEALGSRNYTLFNGHFHAYSHTLRNNHDYIMLGTTGGGQDEKNENSFDHITLVTLADESPLIANLRLDGILDATGKIPGGGDTLRFQASGRKEIKQSNHMKTLTTYLLLNGTCKPAMEFYQSCLGGQLNLTLVKDTPMKNVMPPSMHNKVINAQLKGDGVSISASDWLRPEETPIQGNTVCLYLSGGKPDELKELFRKLAVGASVTDPLREEFHGIYGALNDKFGIRWMFHSDK